MSRHSRISPESSPEPEASGGSRLGRIANGSVRMASTKSFPRSRAASLFFSCNDFGCFGAFGEGVTAKPRLAGSPCAARRATTAHANQTSHRR